MNAALPFPSALPTLERNDDTQALQRRLRSETRGELMFDLGSRGRYATDASIYQIMPTGVFVPTCADDVATAIQICRELHIPLLPRGGGTSQCGESTVIGCANQRRDALVKSGKLSAAWTAIKHDQLALVDGQKGKEWKISYKDAAAQDKTKENLYMFFTQAGNFIAANHSGK